MTAESGLRKRVLEGIVVLTHNHAVINANSVFILEKSGSESLHNTKGVILETGLTKSDLLTGNAMKPAGKLLTVLLMLPASVSWYKSELHKGVSEVDSMPGLNAWHGRGCEVLFDLLSLQSKSSYSNEPIL